MYRNKVPLRKRNVIPPIPDSIIPVDFYKKASIVNFTIDDMTSKFELFSKNKMNIPYLTEIIITCWIQMLDEYWEEIDTT